MQKHEIPTSTRVLAGKLKCLIAAGKLKCLIAAPNVEHTPFVLISVRKLGLGDYSWLKCSGVQWIIGVALLLLVEIQEDVDSSIDFKNGLTCRIYILMLQSVRLCIQGERTKKLIIKLRLMRMSIEEVLLNRMRKKI